MAVIKTVLAAADYDLGATLDSGQAFRWRQENGFWTGVIGRRCVRLRQHGNSIFAETTAPCGDWRWLEEYLQPGADLEAVLKTFPDDPPLREAVQACRGLRLLRQEPWECLASFILSSTKQIVQIRQIVARLSERFGEPIDGAQEFSFPTAARIAAASEAELRDCKMGFRAPYLLGTARRVVEGSIDLAGLRGLPLEAAREELMRLPGVGRKIADCVLLFGCGFDGAFPIDVWVLKALRRLYFPKRRPDKKRLERFAATHFGPHAGYAQQYLFHYIRTKIR
jgi:N-glycosylase/DNA lyase